MPHVYKGKNKPACCDKSLLENDSPVYYHVFEVCSGKTDKVLEQFKYTLENAIKFAKEHLEEEPYIKDCLYEKSSNEEISVDVVWTSKENIDDEICFYCHKNTSKADLRKIGVGNEHVELCPNCRWLLGTRRITLNDIADRLPSNMSSKNPDRITFQPGVYGYHESLTETYNETTYVYIVHSDINENNIYAEFATEEEAIDYAKRHKDELTYVDKAEVALDENGYIDEVFDSETIWVYNEDYNFEKPEEDNPFELDFYDYNFPLDEGVKLRTKAEQDEFFRLCNEIGIYTSRDLENFMKEVDCTPETLLQALRDYRAELGPDFKIINEEANLVEDYELDEISVAEIKAELDYNGEVWFTDEVDESDEDGWRGASDFIIVDMGNGKYEGYRNWTDQEGEDLEYGSEEYFDDFEEVLYFIDGKYAKIVDLNEYIGSELAEGLEEAIKMTRDEMIEKEGTDNVDLINAGREEEDRVELEESQAQEISREYDRLSKKYGIDFEDLVYGEEGFMKTNYPDNFPDFAGDVIYSEKYWNELVEFAKEKGIDLK